MAPHSSTLAWKIPWMEEPGRLQSMGSLRVGHDWATSLSLFTFTHWRRKWQLTPVFLSGESQGQGSLMGCRLWSRRVGHDWSDLAAAVAELILRLHYRYFKAGLKNWNRVDVLWVVKIITIWLPVVYQKSHLNCKYKITGSPNTLIWGSHVVLNQC